MAPPPVSWLSALASDVRNYWPLWAIVAAAIATRLYGFDHVPGMQGDEGWYGVQILNLMHGQGGEFRTPTGNVPGLIHGGSLALLHSLFSPSLWLLRLPALISSLVAVAAAYAVGRRYFGPAAGMTSLVLMACLPINLAYARLGWDPSHGPLLVLVAAYCALAGHRLLTVLVFALALSNHPSAVFVAPWLILGYFGFERERLPWRAALLRTVSVAFGLAVATLLAMQLSAGAGRYVDASKSLLRLSDIGLWADFGLAYARLLSGDTIYRYIVGQGYFGAGPWIDAATVSLLLAVLAAGLFTVVRKSDWPIAGMIAGWLASLAGLYIVAGLWTLQPGLERFGFPMIPVTVVTVAAIVGRLVPIERFRLLLQVLLSAIALPLLAGFWFCYLIPLESGKALPNPGSWTGRVEPHRLAIDLIARAAGPSGEARVIAEDWWSYWPAAYYATGKRLMTVNAGGEMPSAASPAYPGGTYWIAYGGGQLDRELARRAMAERRWSVATSNPDNYLQIWWTPPARSQVVPPSGEGEAR